MQFKSTTALPNTAAALSKGAAVLINVFLQGLRAVCAIKGVTAKFQGRAVKARLAQLSAALQDCANRPHSRLPQL